MATLQHSEDAPPCVSETPTEQFQAIINRMKALRREVLDLPAAILIPPERHDNRQKYAMHIALEYALAAVSGDNMPTQSLTEAIRENNERLPWEIVRDNAADAELLAAYAEFEVAEKAFRSATEGGQDDANDHSSAIATKIAAIPARTPPGLAAKLKVLASDVDATNGANWTKPLILSLAADGERLAMTAA
jgi:hypothetical protein